MTTGHVNPGYRNIVSRFNSAIQNPTGHPRRAVFDKQELEDIKSRSKDVWSLKDNSLTTYGWYFNEPQIKEKAELRPCSPTRRNNPHPKLVFLYSRLKKIPGYFNEPEKNQEETKDYSELSGSETNKSRASSMNVYPNANQYINSLTKSEAEIEESRLKKLGIDTETNNTKEVLKKNVISHFQTHGNKVLISETKLDFDPRPKTNRLSQLQSNQTNPFLYEETRMYKEKYKNGDHGIPFNNPRKPFRGDFLIHPDWHPGLRHHRLPYL